MRLMPRMLVNQPAVCVNRRQPSLGRRYYLLYARVATGSIGRRVWRMSYANHQEAIRDVADYRVNFYNSKRLHSTKDYLAPHDYKFEMASKQPILLSENS
jgi:hypothetical protein